MCRNKIVKYFYILIHAQLLQTANTYPAGLQKNCGSRKQSVDKNVNNVYLVFLVITPSFSAITIHRFIFLFYLIQIMILFFNPLQVDCYTRIERNCLWRSNPVNCVYLKLAIYFIIIFKPIMQIYKSIWSPDQFRSLLNCHWRIDTGRERYGRLRSDRSIQITRNSKV